MDELKEEPKKSADEQPENNINKVVTRLNEKRRAGRTSPVLSRRTRPR